MAIIELEDKIAEIVKPENRSDFLYQFLEVYDIPRATITRLKNGNQNLAKRAGEVHLKNKVWFKETMSGKLFNGFVEVEQQVGQISAKPRFIFVTDYEGILAKDTKTQEALDIKFEELPQYFDFFLAWKGIEKVEFEKENPADIKAAERFARLYDVLRNENNITESDKGLDMFLIRLLFCLFAEDTEIFKRNSFTNSIKTLTEENGSDLNEFFTDLFIVLDKTDRKETPTYLKEFPYVNGQLFTERHEELQFSTKSRKLIIECGELLNWGKINPDIFGSMIQAVATDESRSHLGMHYTSVPNIMKVIKPLFLDDLYEVFEKSYDSMDKLNLLYDRIGKIKFFDPACGSGNFLIITYKELRRLEIKILLRQRELSPTIWYLPSVTLDQFYGIEIDDFAHDVAKLSLWIAEHQMNTELEEVFNDRVRPTLPLQSAGDIRCANALQINWNEICPHSKNEEVYVFGNPPYLGSYRQNTEHKKDMANVFKGIKGYKILDYISAFFVQGARYIENSNVKLAFVTTNSISQGDQVATLWKEIFKYKVEIIFSYNSFKWKNSARNNAGVTVVIIGLSYQPVNNKKIFSETGFKVVDNINAYLAEGENILVEKKNKSVNGWPKMSYGNKANDKGGLIFSIEEYENTIAKYPELIGYFKKLIGAVEFINGGYRYCLWINKQQYEEVKENPIINARMEYITKIREESTDSSVNRIANQPYRFRDINETHNFSIVVPSTSSENRYYIPMGIVDSEKILTNAVYAIYDAEVFLLGVLMSRMHMVWVKTVAGRLKTDYRYSAGLCYNTFPFPAISTRRKNEIEETILEILDIREEHGGTLAELYNPETMPLDLKVAHDKLDGIIERAYRQRAFESDEERLELLLKMYQMTEREA
ncbi:DNA methyltransferase [Bacillus sp. ISL-39]|uniref:class I SAM-dependent DNA methyltransferase n=1 Tax=Bacillus sp. ISL-39 TaxID=2819124 RepID=UPI001BEA0EB8|nr:DNA methyltransferase [Bacillus sp. ISL-39]MBT2636567.1 class I SAM-dependent DNA methyltransferase [Bacillus sp. ISL-39]